MKTLEVVAAIILYGNEILCTLRPAGKYPYISYKFEFPGGKIEPGESRVEALKRELKEELDMDVNIEEKDYFMSVTHKYPDFEITMHGYICRVKTKNLTRKEHIDHKWLTKDQLLSLDWAAADIPFVEKIMGGAI
jgi:8-oxo-dGTP diphosphatase